MQNNQLATITHLHINNRLNYLDHSTKFIFKIAHLTAGPQTCDGRPWIIVLRPLFVRRQVISRDLAVSYFDQLLDILIRIMQSADPRADCQLPTLSLGRFPTFATAVNVNFDGSKTFFKSRANV